MACWWIKISHVYPKVVTETIEWLRSKHETMSNTKLNVMRGNVHEFLGMKFYYYIPSHVKVSMFEYMKYIIDEFPDDRKTKKVNTPESTVLFKIIPDTKLISTKYK